MNYGKYIAAYWNGFLFSQLQMIFFKSIENKWVKRLIGRSDETIKLLTNFHSHSRTDIFVLTKFRIVVCAKQIASKMELFGFSTQSSSNLKMYIYHSHQILSNSPKILQGGKTCSEVEKHQSSIQTEKMLGLKLHAQYKPWLAKLSSKYCQFLKIQMLGGSAPK